MIAWARGLVLGSLAILEGVAGAQEPRWASNVIVPQIGAFSLQAQNRVEIKEVNAAVAVRAQLATTTLDIHLHNPTSVQLESEIILPVPRDAVVRGFTFQGSGSEPTAALLPRDEAKRLYDSIVRAARDPALLEFIGLNLIRSSVFPVPAHGDQRVRLIYEHVCPTDANRIDYVLPRSESVEYAVPWRVLVRIESTGPISTIYSPTHRVETQKRGATGAVVRMYAGAARDPGPFRVSWLLDTGDVTASFFAYPDPQVGGGYFLLLAGLPAEPRITRSESQKRDLILVLDRSGSMAGAKLKQVQQAAIQIVESLEHGETFNIIVYNEAVDSLAGAPVVKNDATLAEARRFLAGLTAQGGTNIYDSLSECLRQRPAEGSLPLALYLTDGLPTVGRTAEVAIRELAIHSNKHHRRLFTFGVGADVNTPLLERLADETRGVATFVLPGEDAGLSVGNLFKRLSNPVLADPELRAAGAEHGPRKRVRELMPAKLPDLFEGDQLVVLGQYVGEDPIDFQLEGNYRGHKRVFQFHFSLDKASTTNAFVSRLWASRKIGMLVDAIRQLGANEPATFVSTTPPNSNDPRFKELVDEVVRLSTQFGILTEYTAFFAREGIDLNRKADVIAEANRNFLDRAVRTRSGLDSVSQSLNTLSQKSAMCLNGKNYFLDKDMKQAEVSTVQQVCDRAFFKRGNQWIDSRLLDNETSASRPDQVIEFGSEAFQRLAERLAEENRQGTISLRGDILIQVDGKSVLVTNSGSP